MRNSFDYIDTFDRNATIGNLQSSAWLMSSQSDNNVSNKNMLNNDLFLHQLKAKQ